MATQITGLDGQEATDSNIDMSIDPSSAPKIHPFFSRDPSKTLLPSNPHTINNGADSAAPLESSITKSEDLDKAILPKKRGRPKKAAKVSGQPLDYDFPGFAKGSNGIVNIDAQNSALTFQHMLPADGIASNVVGHGQETSNSGSRKAIDKGQRQLNFTSSNIAPSPLLSQNLNPQQSTYSPDDEIQVPATSSPPRIVDEAASTSEEHMLDQFSTAEQAHDDLFNKDIASSELLSLQSGATKVRSRPATIFNASEPPRKKRRSEGYKQLTMSAMYGETSREEAAPIDPKSSEPVSKPSLIVKLKVKAPIYQPYSRPSLIVKLKVAVPEKLPERPKKPLHPFFMKGSAKPRNSAATHPHPTSETDSDVPLSNNNSSDANQKPLVTSFGGLQLSTKPKWQVFVDPPWPAPGAVHVRGLPQQDAVSDHDSTDLETYCAAKPKGKDKQFQFPESESIFRVISRRLKLGMQAKNYCSSAEISPFVRIPARIELTATPLLKEQLRAVLKTRLSSSSLHPALRNLRDILGECEALTTQFDMLKPQTVAWTNKYAPKNTAEILQDSQDLQVLSKWLQQMKVWSVGTAPPPLSNGSKPEPRHKAKKKPRKKRRDDLEGFLVSDDEDYNTMDEITDPEDHSASIWRVRRPPRSEARIPTTRYTDLFDEDEEYSDPAFSDKEPALVSTDSPKSPPIPRFSNVVILSGPNGVGKTAAVYAAASEQGFSVFEVHAGQRRGKQELIDLVGDMTKNHLVHQDKSVDLTDMSLDREEKTQQDGPKDKPKTQRQSLILIEEADILFEEDKFFWPQVLNLVAESKRPVVITCNGPEMVHKEGLEQYLYAELCFSIPPKDLTVDYLLMLCAVEGHLLNRVTVEQLYDQCKGDLRMAIMQLDFWCRMAVGDRTGGLKWAVKRWPPGVDMEEGEILRCFSADTYLPAMGQFGRELLPETSESLVGIPLQTEDDCWSDIIENTGVDLSAKVFHDVHNLMAHSNGYTNNSSLAIFDEFLETFSDMDVFARCQISTSGPVDRYSSYMTILDPTHPRQHERHDADDIVGVNVLNTAPLARQISTERDLAIFVGLEAYKALKSQVTSNYKLQQNTIFTEPDIASLVTSGCDEVEQLDYSSRHALKSLFEKPLLPSMNSFPPPNPGIYQFHQPFSVFIADISPFVRTIARADYEREQARPQMGNLLSMGGSGSSGRRRNTRAAATAECGGTRGKGRRDVENYLPGNIKRMIETAGEGWALAVEQCISNEISLYSDDNDSASERSASNIVTSNDPTNGQEIENVIQTEDNVNGNVTDDTSLQKCLENGIVQDGVNIIQHPIINGPQVQDTGGLDMEMAD